MNGIETFLSLYGLPAMFIVLLVKSIGVPIPIPADVIMLADTEPDTLSPATVRLPEADISEQLEPVQDHP